MNRFFVIAAAFVSLTSVPAAAVTVEVVEPGVRDFATTVCAYEVIEYSDAYRGGGDWLVTGSGQVGGTDEQLWLFATTLSASTQLSEPTSAVAFVMVGDGNDGLARFSVDGQVVADIDMFMAVRTFRTVVVSDLPQGAHELSVQYLGGNDGIAILGGAALVASMLDSDSDGIVDSQDNCLAAVNPDQRDTDGDGYGNACDADFNNDCAVDFADLAHLQSVFFTADSNGDLNGDSAVNFIDLAILKASFAADPGPSGVVSTCGCN